MRPDSPAAPRPATMRRCVPAMAVAAVFAVFVFLHWSGRYALSDGVLLSWGMLPFPFPFLDTDTVLSALRCLREGIDVFETNPCDVLTRVYDYSPVWLHAAAFPVTIDWIVPVGLGVDVVFILSLFLLPAGRDWRCTALVTVGTVSTAVAYAMERANNDLVIFTLVALGAALSTRRWPFRLFGYGCAFMAGVLKYYPMLTMVLAVRERPTRFVAVTVIAVAALAAIVAADYTAFSRALQLIPTGPFYVDMFGARTLPGGVLHLTRFSAWAHTAELALTTGSIAIGLAMVLWGRIDVEISALTARERAFLLAGAALLIACFFTAQNIGYRAIHLVLVLPGLTALAVLAPRRHLWVVTAGFTALLLWAEAWRHWINAAALGQPIWHNLDWGWRNPDRFQFIAWEIREVLWWWVITVLWGVSFAIVRRSTLGEAVLAWGARRLGLGSAPLPAARDGAFDRETGGRVLPE